MELHNNKLEEKKNEGRAKGLRGDLSDTGIVNDQHTSSVMDQQEDSFQKMYSKELDLDEDEVPIILHELNDSAIHFISRDQYERALSLLQKAQTLIDRLQFQKNPNDRLMVFLTMHNMALCFQKLGALEECALCLEASLQTINSPFLVQKFSGDPAKKLKRLKYECKARMQVCALLSQLHRHKDALQHAERSVQIAQYMISDLSEMCKFYYSKVIQAKKNEQIAQELMNHDQQQQLLTENSQMKDLIYYDDSVSMLERTAYRILPIIQDCASRMIKTSDLQQQIDERTVTDNYLSELMKPKLNMKAVLGYLNQSEWLYLLNIGNIMQITPLTVHDMYSNTSFEAELARDSILEKISFLAVSYFCISTELRFLMQVKDDPTIDPARKKKESEYWHAKALEVSVSFLPSECPLVTHILTSYQKHHAPVQQEIPEDQETTHGLKVIRPLPGIDIAKFQPMVRQDLKLNITLPNLPLSPNNYISVKQDIQQQMSQVNFQKLTETSSSQNINPTSASTTMRQHQSNRLSSKQGGKQMNHQRQHPKPQQILSQNQQLDTSVEADETVLEEQDSSAANNKSMMDVVPSSNYTKLLQDLSNMQQNSSDIMDQEDQFFDEQQKESMLFKQRATGKGGKLFEISQDEELDDEDAYGEELDDMQDVSLMQKIDQTNRDKHNLSLDGHQIKRPKTSQGIRKQKLILQQQTDPTTMHISECEDNSLFAKHHTMINNEPSPHNRSTGRQNQSMVTSGKLSRLGVNTLAHANMNISSLTGLNSGAVTNLKGNSTPIKSNSMAVTGANFKSRENMNMSRANIDRHEQQKTNQSSCSELGVGGKRSGSKQRRQRNQENADSSIGKRNTLQPQMSAQRSQSQQKKYLHGSAVKPQKISMMEQMQNSQPRQPLLNDNAKRTMNEIFMIDRMMKKRAQGINTNDPNSKSFEVQLTSDQKYRSQHFGSQSRSKSRGKVASSRSKDKLKTKSSDQQQSSNGNTMNMEELKRQIIMKQALMDSSKNSRRKSTGSQQQNGQQPQKKVIDMQRAQQMHSTSQSSQSQQWFTHNAQQQQSKVKLNTHQMIKKFLKDRQNNTSLNSYMLNNSMLENYQSTASEQQPSTYKLQLSKKILQQQQKLMGGQIGSQYVNEVHPQQQKRSATPMLDERFNSAQQMIIQNSDKSLADIGNLQSKNNMNFLRDYMSVQEFHNQSLREDSIGKSLKKKASKKATPKNVIANSQFSWL